MRSMIFMLSACSAVAQATECPGTDETTLVQGLRMVRKQKLDTKGLDAKSLVKSLQHVAHNFDTMSTDDVTVALAVAVDALTTLTPAIQEQVEILQQTVLDAAEAVQVCHVQEGVDLRAGLWEAAEAQAAEVTSCEAELATAVADEVQICSAASVADVQSECACNEATVRREDKGEICAALTTAYEFAYSEHNLQCNTYHECHDTGTAVYNSIRADVEDDMASIETEYVAAQQSTCIVSIIEDSYLLTPPVIDFDAITACSTVDVSSLLLVYPDMPAAPDACPAAHQIWVTHPH